MSNSPELLGRLSHRCDGRHSFCSRAAGGRHALGNGKVARRAAIYHHELCQAILRGMKAQIILDGTFRRGEAGADIAMHDGDDEVHACYVNVSGIESTGDVRMEDGIARTRSTTPKSYIVENTTSNKLSDGSSSSSTLEWRNSRARKQNIRRHPHAPSLRSL